MEGVAGGADQLMTALASLLQTWLLISRRYEILDHSRDRRGQRWLDRRQTGVEFSQDSQVRLIVAPPRTGCLELVVGPLRVALAPVEQAQ